MPSWVELVGTFGAQKPDERQNWVVNNLAGALTTISGLRGGRNVIFYSSAFLQKPGLAGHWTAVTMEDLNGLMACFHGMDFGKGLTLILHTPGGDVAATQSVVSYIHSKFETVECIVPTYAMSAGTMIALSTSNIVMGRQSQLGPIDAQFQLQGGGQISAGAVVAQFKEATRDIGNDLNKAHVWAPILQSLGPSLYQQAVYALDFGRSMVRRWLEERMFKGREDAAEKAETAANYFNATDDHKLHGRRIDREEARSKDLSIEDLEANQELQEAVLTAYHLMTLLFEISPATKVMFTDTAKVWARNFVENTPTAAS
jgi:Serine dehydrogenase proteinase